MSSRARDRHQQTPVTLCREQSIRGYVSKESMFAVHGVGARITHLTAKPSRMIGVQVGVWCARDLHYLH